MHPFFFQGPHAHIYDIAGNKYQVWFLCIYHIYPAMKLCTRIVIADVQVADHNQFQRANHWTVRGQRQFLTIFMLIVQIAINKDAYHQDGNAKNSVPIII